MSHDLLAELAGYRNELAGAEARGSERAAQIRTEIERVEAAVTERAAELIAQAETHEGAGQDVLAAQARIEARRLTDAAPAPARTANSRTSKGK